MKAEKNNNKGKEMKTIANYKNICMIYTPHYMSQCFRVACDKQRGADNNYIIVTCAPQHNGVYQYPASVTKNAEIWMNGKKQCYCIPISECTKIKDLDELSNPDTISRVKKQQTKWYESTVKNRDYTYKKKPEWML